MFERILCPTDFSEVSLHALNHCIPELVKMVASVVIMGKRGRGMVKEILISSAANAIMRRSELLVLNRNEV